MEQEEIWKPVAGYEGLYSCSSLGRIRSEARITSNNHYVNSKILKQYVDKDGYHRVHLCKNGKCYQTRVNRIIGKAFVYNDDPEHKTQCNHINELVWDNRACNIEWVTPRQNINHGTRNKRVSEKMTNGKLSKQILQYTINGDFVREWPSIHEIRRTLGASDALIINCCKNKQHYKTAYGYIWRYKEKDAA